MEAGRLDRADRALQEAGRIAQAAGDQRLAARARVQRLLLGLQVDIGHAHREVGEALPGLLGVFGRTGDEVGLCQAWRLRAFVHWTQASSTAAEDAWRQAAVHARRAEDERQLTEVLGWLASAALWGPTPAPEGIRRCERFLTEVGSHQTGEAVILNHLAGLYAMQGRAEEANQVLARGLAAFEELGATMTSSVTHPASFVAMLAGDTEAAEVHLRRDYRRLEQMGEQNYLATTAAFLAQAVAAQGRHDEAERFIGVSRDTGAGEDFLGQVIAEGLLARILAARGQLAEAEELARAAVALAARTDFLNQHGDALLELAAVLAETGRRSEARATVGEALGCYERKGNLIATAQARQRLERLPARDKIREPGRMPRRGTMAASQFNSQATQLDFDGRTRVGGPQNFGSLTDEVEYRFLLVQGDVVVQGSGTGRGGTWEGTTHPDQPPLQEGRVLAIGLAFAVENLRSPGFTTFSWADQVEVVNG